MVFLIVVLIMFTINSNNVPDSINNAVPDGNDNYGNVQLNDLQGNSSNYVMKLANECHLSERNDQPIPEPFHMFLSGGAGVL